MSKPNPKSQRVFPGVWALALGLALAACSSSPMSRIDSNRAVYESWPVEMQEAVHNGRAVPGMTPEMVEMALGKPTSVDSRSAKDGTEEIWVYKKSSGQMPAILRNANIGIGTNIGGVGVGTNMPVGGSRGGSRAPVDSEDQEIVFKNGVVTRGSG
jgi:hypothetical protein